MAEHAKLKQYRGKWCIEFRKTEIINGEVCTTRKRISLRTTDRLMAERRLEQWKADLRRSAETTVNAAWDIYWADKGKEREDHSSRCFLPFFGHLDTNDINVDLCKAYVEKRRGDLTKRGTPVQDGTIIRELQSLRAALNYAAKPGHRDFKVVMPKKPAPRERYLTKGEFKKFIAVAQKNERLALFLELALATAGRKTAITELTWDRVDFERRLLDLRNPERDESNKRRALVTITDRLYDALTKAREKAQTQYVLEYKGDRYRDPKKAFAKAMKEAGIEHATPHDIRRTAAVWMAEAGVSMSEISQYLGHSNTRVTESVYARYSPDYLKGAAKALDF